MPVTFFNKYIFDSGCINTDDLLKDAPFIFLSIVQQDSALIITSSIAVVPLQKICNFFEADAETLPIAIGPLQDNL